MESVDIEQPLTPQQIKQKEVASQIKIGINKVIDNWKAKVSLVPKESVPKEKEIVPKEPDDDAKRIQEARKMIKFAYRVLYGADEMSSGDKERARCLRSAAIDLLMDRVIEIGKIENRLPSEQPDF